MYDRLWVCEYVDDILQMSLLHLKVIHHFSEKKTYHRDWRPGPISFFPKKWQCPGCTWTCLFLLWYWCLDNSVVDGGSCNARHNGHLHYIYRRLVVLNCCAFWSRMVRHVLTSYVLMRSAKGWRLLYDLQMRLSPIKRHCVIGVTVLFSVVGCLLLVHSRSRKFHLIRVASLKGFSFSPITGGRGWIDSLW